MIRKSFGTTSVVVLLSSCQMNNQNEEITTENSSTTSESDNFGRGAISDGKDTNASEAPTKNLSKSAESIVIYFSRSGHTEELAKEISETINSDLLELQVKNPYPSNYEETVDRATYERENELYPELSTDMADLTQYQTVILGHPIWAMTLANPMVTFIQRYEKELEGKTVTSFSTNAGYGSGDTFQRLSELLPKSNIEEVYTVEDRNVKEDKNNLNQWLSEFKEGE